MRRFLFPTLGVFLFAIVAIALFRPHPPAVKRAPMRVVSADPLAVVLTPLGGTGPVDKQIADLQQKIRQSPQRPELLEQLGWIFVNKARVSSDPGYYKLAEQCANALEQKTPGVADAELLRGHIYHALHRFHDAEVVARKLTQQRDFVFDYALLGDALMEQGKLEPAIDAYQKMVDLKPCLQTYSRVAYMRWLKGQVPGAVQASLLAVSGGSPKEPEPVAWAYTRLASYELQSGEADVALRSTELATKFVPGYAAALLQRGRVLLVLGKTPEALEALRAAAEKSPLPEYLWTLADALRGAGKIAESQDVEKKLLATGQANDPRTLSLFLASRGEKLDLALRLAQEELTNRQDIFTRDALAWAQLAKGNVADAAKNSQLALAEGTQDGRLFYHAAVIASAAGKPEEARKYFAKAGALAQMLMPSERQTLQRKLATLPPAGATHFSSN